MERRLNCYNYIFSNCKFGGNCPYGHVNVMNKEEYFRKFEKNEDGYRDRTSPRNNDNQNLIFNNQNNYNKQINFKSVDDWGTQISFVICSICNHI